MWSLPRFSHGRGYRFDSYFSRGGGSTPPARFTAIVRQFKRRNAGKVGLYEVVRNVREVKFYRSF